MKIVIALFATSVLVLSSTGCEETPPANEPQAGYPQDGKPTLEIVEGLEEKGYGPITEVSWEQSSWEIEATSEDKHYELRVDAVSGDVLSEREEAVNEQPPVDAKPLSEILKAVTEAGHQQIDDVSFENTYWEIETRDDQGELELHVDPVTAEITSTERD